MEVGDRVRVINEELDHTGAEGRIVATRTVDDPISALLSGSALPLSIRQYAVLLDDESLRSDFKASNLVPEDGAWSFNEGDLEPAETPALA